MGNWITHYIEPFKAAIDLIIERLIDVRSMITKRYEIKDMEKGLKLLKKGDTIKVLIK